MGNDRGRDRTFAGAAAPGGASADARAWERRAASASRLAANADFRDWLFDALVQLCAFGDDMTPVDPFNAGKRAAGAFLRRSLLVAEGGPQLFADLDKRYYGGVRRGIVEAARKNTGNEGIR